MRRGNRGLAGLALLATLALATGVVAGSAASASGGPVARTAGLKKCLKKAKKIQDPVKRKKAKKKCRKKFRHRSHSSHRPGSGDSELGREPAGSGSNIDLDLWVFDSNGNKARAAADTIPNSAFSANDIKAPGTETFTDLVYTNPGGRNFSFGVCYQDGGSQHDHLQPGLRDGRRGPSQRLRGVRLGRSVQHLQRRRSDPVELL